MMINKLFISWAMVSMTIVLIAGGLFIYIVYIYDLIHILDNLKAFLTCPPVNRSL